MLYRQLVVELFPANMKILILLTLLFPDQAHLMSLPPEDRHPSTQSHADPSEADLEFAQVRRFLYL